MAFLNTEPFIFSVNALKVKQLKYFEPFGGFEEWNIGKRQIHKYNIGFSLSLITSTLAKQTFLSARLCVLVLIQIEDCWSDQSEISKSTLIGKSFINAPLVNCLKQYPGFN